jgi:hypothetical protein
MWSTNATEGFFATLKRGINGVYHYIGKQPSHRRKEKSNFVPKSVKPACQRALRRFLKFAATTLSELPDGLSGVYHRRPPCQTGKNFAS